MDALANRIGPAFFRLGVTALWAYLCAVIPFGRIFPSRPAATGGAVAVFAAGCVAIAAIPRMRIRLLPVSRMLEVGLASVALVLTLLAGDFAFTLRDNWLRSKSEAMIDSEARGRDSTVWHGELYPRTFTPAGKSFALYKPNVRVTGETYGERYVSAMLRSRTLVDSVLERRHLSYFIGPDGFRELEPLSESRIFALGDSFVFGFATDEGKIWPDLLGAALKEPVYNLGVSATGPRPQLEVLKYMLEKHPESMHIRHLLWMVFEGNDLENSYAESPAGASPPSPGLLQGTLIEPFLSLPERVRRGSVVGRLARGDLTLSAGASHYGQYQIDGVDLPLPLFHSKKFGYRLFVPADMEAATRPRDYVLNHPNRPLLDRTFEEMRDLSRRLSFQVTVVIAPSDARLHGAAYDGFPILSAQPWFIDYVDSLSGRMGFSVVNLLPLLQPFARDELLYYRDDHHWNVRGNAVVAQLLAAALARPDGR